MFYVAYRWLVFDCPIFWPTSMPEVNQSTDDVRGLCLVQNRQHSEVSFFELAKVENCSLEKLGKYELPGGKSVHRRLSFSKLLINEFSS